MPSVQVCRDPMVERKGVPREPPTRSERPRDTFEGAPPVIPGRQVQESTKRAVDESRWLVEQKVAHVALAQIELHACSRRSATRLLEHRRGRIDTEDGPPGSERNRDPDTAVPDPELDERPIDLAR